MTKNIPTPILILAAISLFLGTMAPAAAAPTEPPRQGQGLKQANSMGAGPAAIPGTGTFRVFVLAGQSNMTGQGRGRELEPPHSKPHDRIRVWANGRWEYFVPRKTFGPGVSLAHRLASHWPEDTIGIIKVAIGGTGILSFQPDWTRESADRSGDGRKGSLYKDIVDAVNAARAVSDFEIAGFVWKQGGKDMKSMDLANEYFDNFEKMITSLRRDLNAPEMPAFVATYASKADIVDRFDALKRGRPGLETVIIAQNEVSEKIPRVITVVHGEIPCHEDGIHYNTEGQLKFGEIIADAVESCDPASAAATSPPAP